MCYPLYLPPGVEEVIRRVMLSNVKRNTANVERALWIVSEIAKRSQLEWLVRNGFAATSYDRLNRGCPRNLIPGILKTLIKSCVIERDNWYLPAKFDPAGEGKSYGYRLAGRFRGIKLVRTRGHSLAVADTLARSFQRQEIEQQLSPLPHPYSELDRMAKRIYLIPDAGEPDYVDDLMDPVNRWAVVDEFGQRFHETHQSVPRRHRHRLRIGRANEPPFVLDIATSQPLILTRQVMEEAERRRAEGRGAGNRRGRTEGREAGAARDHIAYPDFDGILNDVEEIQRLCVDGDLYSALIPDLQQLAPVRDDDPYRDAVHRERAKTEFMIFCMSRAEVILHSDAGKAVRRRWPDFWAAVYCLARDNEPKHVARMLQRKESEMVLLGASARILSDRPTLTFGTVHDAIVCQERHTRYIRGCIEDAYHRGIGVVPRIRVEPYGRAG